MTIQSAMSPGTRGRHSATKPAAEAAPKTPDDLIIKLVIEDPFSTISELSEQAAEISPEMTFGWWQVFNILRRNRLLGKRSRFRMARRRMKKNI